MKRITTLLSVFSILAIHSGFTQNAAGITDFKGTVIDGKTHEPLQGASITLINPGNPSQKMFSFSGLNGSFIVRNIPDGNYHLRVSYVGYIADSEDVSLDLAAIAENKTIALAQEEKPNTTDVVVYSHRYSSEQASFLADKNSNIIQNSISARAIELSPDLSVANTAQRISGVSLERSTNGEGQYVIIRGMDKRYIYTLVNGIKIPSPDNKNRYVPLDIFPNDLLERLEIFKSLTPNMEGDAIGGAINMVMKDAPSKFSVTANLGAGYASGSKDFNKFSHYPSLDASPRSLYGSDYQASLKDFPYNMFSHTVKSTPVATQGNFTLGGRLFNNKLGIIVGGSYLNNYKNVKSLFFEQNTESNNGPQISSEDRRNYSIRQQRTGLQGKLDYQFNQNNKIALFGMWTSLQKYEYKFAADTNLILGRAILPGTGRVSLSWKDVYEKQQIANATLTGNHIIANNFTINWIGAYSKAILNRPDEGTLSANNQVVASNGSLVATPVNLDDKTSREFTHSSDEDKSGYLNLTYKSTFGNTHIDWSAGGMYRNKTRHSEYDDYRFTPDGNFGYEGYVTGHSFIIGNPQGSATNALNYDAKENVGAAYAMATLDWNDKLHIVGGVRYEHTYFNWENNVPPTADTGHTGIIKYYDILPSANIKYSLNKNQALRLSYYAAISRPNFYEVVPHILQEAEDDYAEEGNPHLKHSTSNNFDLKYEYYFTGIDEILAGVFYKRIKNPIEYALANEKQGLFYKAENFGNASNYGFELDATKYFRWFGIKANYTYTNSRITTSKVVRSTGEMKDETRPMQGQAKHIANLSLLYKDDNKVGLNAQLALNYTSKRINTVSEFYNEDVWQKGFTQLDFSVEKRVVKHWYIYAKVNNILNTPYQLYVPQAYTGGLEIPVPHQTVGKNIFIRKDTYGQNYLLGIKFKF
ncbi:hypothetical protein A9P82_11420 [Arachidicoccus ginsenosidimutans]|uniref:TonB-dependent receptor domain-containing protein n=1 Tax=Arachidicoccus sp. BS20 TaxID=1850526 RepID=UPI0007F11E35|nr:TonB-dependent receptor [Arachidicoccus sp. BS20]ANI89842.1 hypothetical protein A9P82_11420 [Arachidicoccus sp. BS20]